MKDRTIDIRCVERSYESAGVEDSIIYGDEKI